MDSIFEADDYKEFLNAWIEARPKRGRGESRRMAEKLGVSTTLISQILNGDKNFTMEAASDLCDHIGLGEKEAEHFLLLVDFARAGSHGLKSRIKKKINKSREEMLKITARFERDLDLSEAQAAVYYSHWVYTGITNWIATRPTATPDEISERLKVPLSMVMKVLAFLLEAGILVHRTDQYEIGAKRTFISADSPLVIKHHQNWRLRGFNQMPYADEKQNLFFTAPMSISREVADRIRADLPNYIAKVTEWVGPSESEAVRCLNIDWFEY